DKAADSAANRKRDRPGRSLRSRRVDESRALRRSRNGVLIRVANPTHAEHVQQARRELPGQLRGRNDRARRTGGDAARIAILNPYLRATPGAAASRRASAADLIDAVVRRAQIQRELLVEYVIESHHAEIGLRRDAHVRIEAAGIQPIADAAEVRQRDLSELS